MNETLEVLMEDVVIHAVEWWHGRCPHAWTLEQHLASPLVNAHLPHEAMLARAVSAYLQAQHRKDRRNSRATPG